MASNNDSKALTSPSTTAPQTSFLKNGARNIKEIQVLDVTYELHEKTKDGREIKMANSTSDTSHWSKDTQKQKTENGSLPSLHFQTRNENLVDKVGMSLPSILNSSILQHPTHKKSRAPVRHQQEADDEELVINLDFENPIPPIEYEFLEGKSKYADILINDDIKLK